MTCGLLRYGYCHGNAPAITDCACVFTDNRLIVVSMSVSEPKLIMSAPLILP